MKIVDLSHTMSIHTPGWVGYAGNKMYYAQNLQTVGIVAQRVETSMHSGTHFDGAMHATDGRTGDMASLPLDYLVSHGVVVGHRPLGHLDREAVGGESRLLQGAGHGRRGGTPS